MFKILSWIIINEMLIKILFPKINNNRFTLMVSVLPHNILIKIILTSLNRLIKEKEYLLNLKYLLPRNWVN